MSNKLLDLSPGLSLIPERDLDLSKFNEVAIPVIPGEKPQIIKSRFLTLLTNFTKLDLNIELANWPEFTSKPGEIIEVQLSADNLTRIYSVGIGAENTQALRQYSDASGGRYMYSNYRVTGALSD